MEKHTQIETKTETEREIEERHKLPNSVLKNWIRSF